MEKDEQETLPCEEEVGSSDPVLAVDINGRVFQAIAVQCISKVEGVSLVEGNLLDQLLGRDQEDRAPGIHVEHDAKQNLLNLKVEVKVAYGINIPRKAEELQSKIVAEIRQLTGLQVGCVQVVFCNLVYPKKGEELGEEQDSEVVSLPEVGQESQC